jgi:hypothetical protein
MRAIFGANAGLCLAIGLLGAGCTTVPELPPIGHEASIRQVVDRIQCELYETISGLYEIPADPVDKPKNNLRKTRKNPPERKFDWIQHYSATATLALAVNAEGGISPEITLLGPFKTGDFSLGFGGGFTAGASRIATYEFSMDFFPPEETHLYDWCSSKRPPGYPPLQGNLGFGEWFTTVMLSMEPSDTFKRPDKLSHRTEFVLEGNLKLTPTYTLPRSKGNAGLSIERKDTHTLNMVFVYADPEASFDKVCVINAPGATAEKCKKKYLPATSRRTSDVRAKADRQGTDLNLRGIQLELQRQRIR